MGELEGSFGLRIRHLFMVLLGGRRPEAWNVVGVINCTSDQHLTDYGSNIKEGGVQEHRIALMPEQGSLYWGSRLNFGFGASLSSASVAGAVVFTFPARCPCSCIND